VLLPINNQIKNLRTGFTTGACAAAGAKAAWLLYNGKKNHDNINIIFPDKKHRCLKIDSSEMRNGKASVSLIKDAGDDPDVTDKARITVKINPISAGEISSRDYTIDILDASFVIRGGKGVGYATKRGLPVPEGKWAINPVPLKMISGNIAECEIRRRGLFLLDISVKNGEKIARKTLNPALGIKGGISILGTSGIVVPYSNKAYIDTVKILLRGAAEYGIKHIILCTGGSTARALKKTYPKIPEIAIVRIGDFINPAIKFASSLGFDKITVACMPGKLLKYAEGHKNTHAHNVAQQFSGLAKFAKKIGAADKTVNRIKNAAAVREIFDFVKPDIRAKLLDNMTEKALNNFHKWTGSQNIEIVVFDPDGKPVTTKSYL
jgi:cobalt-precorrin-5B (C1)-methyltransferase